MQAESTINSGPSAGHTVRIVLAAIVVQLTLGTVYGWSVFVKPLMEANGWSRSNVTLAFSLAIFFLGIGAFLAGRKADRNPRQVAILGGLMLGSGILLAGYAVGLKSLALLYLGYGVLGGLGMGMGYLVPITVAIKWVPHRRGFISGLVVMGFGAGAVIIGTAGPGLIGHFGAGKTLMGMGLTFVILCSLAGQFLANPPSYAPKSASPDTDVALASLLRRREFRILWGMLFLNVVPGIALISQASPMAREMQALTPERAGTLVAVIAVFNGLGRVFWSSLSDVIGRRTVFLVMYAGQIAAFAALPFMPNVWWFGLLCSYILLCYGGGFGTMPAFTADLFGPHAVGRVYGPILTAWSAAGLASPLLYAFLREKTGAYHWPLYLTAGLLALACILPAWPDAARRKG
jgi:MFS transporter, OFA family, oxalate/formate antiporter